jgi:4-azaleucine resistance transporter AzlC
MSYRHAPALRAAFSAGIPVLLGYVTLGTAFGSGLTWWLAPLMSLVIYAGAAQFMAVGLLLSGAGPLEAALVAGLVNSRHAVYGLSLLEAYKGAGVFKPYLIFALTDETYGLLTTLPAPVGVEPKRYYFLLSLLNQAWWLSGTLLGAIAGRLLPFRLQGLDFALTALFTVLVIEQARACPSRLPFIIAVVTALPVFWLVPGNNALVLALLAGLAGLALLRGRLPR